MKSGILNPPLLKLANRVTSNPIQSLFEEQCSPYKQLDSKSIQLLPLLPYGFRNSDQLWSLLEKLNGESPTADFTGFEKIFGTKLVVESPRYYTTLSDAIDTVETERTKQIKSRILLVCLEKASPHCGFYHKLKIECIKAGLPSQFISSDTLKRFNRSMKSILRNIALAVFCKSGGQPWVLEHPLQDLNGVVGLTIIGSLRQRRIDYPGVYTAEAFDSLGKSRGRAFAFDEQITKLGPRFIDIDLEKVSNVVDSALKSIRLNSNKDLITEKKSVTVHVRNNPPTEVLDTIQQSILNNDFENFKIIRILSNSIVRIFNPNPNDEKRWPDQGSWGFMESKRRAFLYTSGTHDEFQKSQSSMHHRGEEIPIELSLIRGTEHLSVEDLNHVLKLSRLHHSSTEVIRMRLPITLTLPQKGSILAQCGLSDPQFDVTHLY